MTPFKAGEIVCMDLPSRRIRRGALVPGFLT